MSKKKRRVSEIVCRTRCKYSGTESERFWTRIRRIRAHPRHMEIYVLGCDLQNLENHVLLQLEGAERELKAAKERP